MPLTSISSQKKSRHNIILWGGSNACEQWGHVLLHSRNIWGSTNYTDYNQFVAQVGGKISPLCCEAIQGTTTEHHISPPQRTTFNHPPAWILSIMSQGMWASLSAFVCTRLSTSCEVWLGPAGGWVLSRAYRPPGVDTPLVLYYTQFRDYRCGGLYYLTYGGMWWSQTLELWALFKKACCMYVEQTPQTPQHIYRYLCHILTQPELNCNSRKKPWSCQFCSHPANITNLPPLLQHRSQINQQVPFVIFNPKPQAMQRESS